jgi:hypothetical protein
MGGVTGGSGVSGIVQEEVRPRVDWEIPGTCLQVSSMGYGIPMERCLLNIPPPLGATAMQGAPDPRSRREEPLRWDLLSQGRGLFLKQTHPSTDRRLVSEPAARA